MTYAATHVRTASAENAEASCADHLAHTEALAARQKWTVTAIFRDAGQPGNIRQVLEARQ